MPPKFKWLIAPVVAMVVLAAGCGGSSSSDLKRGAADPPQAGAPSSSSTSVLVGAGRHAGCPGFMAQWQPDYAKSAAAVTVTYGAIGSGGGVDAITNRTVDSARATPRSRPTRPPPARAACRYRGHSAQRS